MAQKEGIFDKVLKYIIDPILFESDILSDIYVLTVYAANNYWFYFSG